MATQEPPTKKVRKRKQTDVNDTEIPKVIARNSAVDPLKFDFSNSNSFVRELIDSYKQQIAVLNQELNDKSTIIMGLMQTLNAKINSDNTQSLSNSKKVTSDKGIQKLKKAKFRICIILTEKSSI